jgi:hypothetical protein
MAKRAKHERRVPEDMGYIRVPFKKGLGALALGTHQATVIWGNLYVTPHHPGHDVNPNAVFLSAVAQHGVHPISGGMHFETAAQVREWASDNTGFITFLTESLEASQGHYFAPELDPRNSGHYTDTRPAQT